MIESRELELIRDYEGQLAVYRLRIEELERKNETLNQTVGWLTGNPELLLQKMTVAGFPALDVKAIYETLDEWHREGGSEPLIEWLRAA